MYNLLGVCIALSALLTVNAIASIAMAALWRSLARRLRTERAATRARIIFALRVFPSAGAVVIVLALFIPSYIAYEPWPTGEVVSAKLGLLASVSAVGIALVVWRGLASWRATRRLLGDWMRNSEPINIDGVSVPAYRLRHSFPVIGIIGVIRPRLFIADHIFASLEENEISAAVAHEAGHLHMRDNLKRVLMRACRDALAVVPCARSLDRAWAEAAEAAADEYVARAGSSVALDLAGALVKIARLAPLGAKPTMPAGVFLIGDEDTGIADRVRRLSQLAESGDGRGKCGTLRSNIATWLCLCALFAVVVYTATNASVLEVLHAGIERIVSLLS